MYFFSSYKNNLYYKNITHSKYKYYFMYAPILYLYLLDQPVVLYIMRGYIEIYKFHLYITAQFKIVNFKWV